MSLNQLIDNSSVANRKWLDIKANSVNILEELKFANTAGTDGQVVTNVDGLPFWSSVLPLIEPGADNTYLNTDGGIVSWQPLNCRIAGYSPYGDNPPAQGGLEPGAQDLSNTSAAAVEFQVELIGNNYILSHPNDTDFIAARSGYFKITFMSAIVEDSSCVQFYFIVNEQLDPDDLRYGVMTTPVTNLSGFDDLPAARNVAAVGCTMHRILYLNSGDKFNVYSSKKYQNTINPFASQYFMGDRNCSIYFEFLGENFTG